MENDNIRLEVTPSPRYRSSSRDRVSPNRRESSIVTAMIKVKNSPRQITPVRRISRHELLFEKKEDEIRIESESKQLLEELNREPSGLIAQKLRLQVEAEAKKLDDQLLETEAERKFKTHEARFEGALYQSLLNRSLKEDSEEIVKSEMQRMNSELEDKNKQLLEHTNEKSLLKVQLLEIRKKLNDKELELEMARAVGKETDRAQIESEVLHQARVKMQKQGEEILRDCNQRLKEERVKNQQLLEEKLKAEEELWRNRREYNEVSGLLQKSQAVITAKEDEIKNLTDQIKLKEESERQRDVLIGSMKDTQSAHLELQNKLEKIKAELSGNSQVHSNHLAQILSDKSAQLRILNEKDLKIANLEIELKTVESRLAKREYKLSKLQKEYEAKKEVNIVIREKNDKIITLSKEKKKLLVDLELLADHLMNQEKKTIAAQEKIKELMALIKKKDQHIERLLSRAYYWYFPVRDDPIDCALARFINSSENPPLVAFVRESQGFYSFGKRKVELRLEMEHLIARTGGGFMTIIEFVEVYTPIELEKEEEDIKRENSPSRRLSQLILNQ